MWFAKVLRWAFMAWAAFCFILGVAVLLEGDTGGFIDLHEAIAAIAISFGIASVMVSELIAALIRWAITRRRIPVARVVRW